MSGRAAWGAGARMVSIRRRALDLSGSFDAESGASNACPDVASQKALRDAASQRRSLQRSEEFVLTGAYTCI